MAGVDTTSLDLVSIRDFLQLENGITEEARLRNLQKLMHAGYSVKQANFVAEWVMQNASNDVNTDPRDVRLASDNPFVELDNTEADELALQGTAHSNATAVSSEPRFLHPRMRQIAMVRDPNAPNFEGGSGGEVAASPHLPASPNYPNPNELAPKNRGYRGGNTPFMPPDGSPLGIINPPPEMQERMLTIEEVNKMREERGHDNDPFDVPSEARAGVPRDVSEQGRPVYSPSNLPTTPETATDNIIPMGESAAENEQLDPSNPIETPAESTDENALLDEQLKALGERQEAEKTEGTSK